MIQTINTVQIKTLIFPICISMSLVIAMKEIIHIVHNIYVDSSLIVSISNSRVQLKGTYPVSMS